jgi:PAS domain S-box-containing protein
METQETRYWFIFASGTKMVIVMDAMHNRFLENFSASGREKLGRSLTREEYGDKAFLFHEGDPADGVCLVLSGEVEIFRELEGSEHALGDYREGDFLGEVAVLDGYGRSASARARGTVTVCKIPKAALLEVLLQEPSGVMLDIFQHLLMYLRRTNDLFLAEILKREKLSLVAEKAGVKLKESEQQLAQALEASGLGAFDWDIVTGEIRHAFRLDQIFGYTTPQANFTFASFVAHVVPEERPQIELNLAKAMAKGDFEEEFEITRADGVRAFLSAHGKIIRNEAGEQVWAVGTIADITDRKQAMEKIAEQAALLDKTQDAILVRELDGRILFWNKGAERMYGWTREEVAGRNVSGLLYTNPQRFAEVNGLAIDQGEWSGELQHLTKDGHEITIEARWTLIRDQEGRPKSVLAINTDITQKKKIEAQFLRAQRMESIGTLAGGIAHDLNNILAPILMSIDLLKPMSDHPQAQSILETIEASAKRGANIVRQVLSFARGLEGQRIEVQPQLLLDELESIIKDTFPKDIRLHFTTPKGTWTILGDPTQIHQVLLNLCVNARDAMPHGGQLTMSIENCVLDEQYVAMNPQVKAGRYVKLGVADTGLGIPPPLINKIFEPFFTTKEIHKGTGLGLSTVMAIVKSHGGNINVYSEPRKGTIFNVYFPAMETSSEARKEQSEQANLPRGNGEMILVIDDEDSILTITNQTLQAYGYRVLTATDGADAVAIYLQHRNEIAVVLTDMMMPIMDGPATIHALLRINPALKIIAASGLNTNGSAAKASAEGVKHFLAKPYTAGTLLKTMRLILDEV